MRPLGAFIVGDGQSFRRERAEGFIRSMSDGDARPAEVGLVPGRKIQY